MLVFDEKLVYLEGQKSIIPVLREDILLGMIYRWPTDPRWDLDLWGRTPGIKYNWHELSDNDVMTVEKELFPKTKFARFNTGTIAMTCMGFISLEKIDRVSRCRDGNIIKFKAGYALPEYLPYDDSIVRTVDVQLEKWRKEHGMR